MRRAVAPCNRKGLVSSALRPSRHTRSGQLSTRYPTSCVVKLTPITPITPAPQQLSRPNNKPPRLPPVTSSAPVSQPSLEHLIIRFLHIFLHPIAHHPPSAHPQSYEAGVLIRPSSQPHFSLRDPFKGAKKFVLVFLSNCSRNGSRGIQEGTPRLQPTWTLTPAYRSPSVSSRPRIGATLSSPKNQQKSR